MYVTYTPNTCMTQSMSRPEKERGRCLPVGSRSSHSSPAREEHNSFGCQGVDDGLHQEVVARPVGVGVTLTSLVG